MKEFGEIKQSLSVYSENPRTTWTETESVESRVTRPCVSAASADWPALTRAQNRETGGGKREGGCNTKDIRV